MASKVEVVPDDQAEQVKLSCAVCGVFLYAVASPRVNKMLAEQWLMLAQGSIEHGQEEGHEVSWLAWLHANSSAPDLS